MTLGQRIQELRKQSNLSQEALGEKLGVSRQAVSRWEMDGAVPEVDKLIAMGRLFGVDLNDLLQVDQPGLAGEGETPGPVPEGEGEAPGPAPEGDGPLHPVNWWKWLPPILALLALVLGLVALTLSFGRITGKLGDRLTALESRVEELEARPIQPAGLDPSARLVGDFGWNHSKPYQLDVYLSPFQRVDDLEVTFHCTRASDNFTKIFSSTQNEAGLFTATLYVQDMTPAYTISAVISDGAQEFTQSLVRITDASRNQYSFELHWNKETL